MHWSAAADLITTRTAGRARSVATRSVQSTIRAALAPSKQNAAVNRIGEITPIRIDPGCLAVRLVTVIDNRDLVVLEINLVPSPLFVKILDLSLELTGSF